MSARKYIVCVKETWRSIQGYKKRDGREGVTWHAVVIGNNKLIRLGLGLGLRYGHTEELV